MKPKQNPQISEEEQEVLEQLRENPEIYEQVKGMLDEIRDRGDKMETADEAEEAMVKRVREIGRLGLSGWAKRKADESQRQAPQAGARRGGKKN